MTPTRRVPPCPLRPTTGRYGASCLRLLRSVVSIAPVVCASAPFLSAGADKGSRWSPVRHPGRGGQGGLIGEKFGQARVHGARLTGRSFAVAMRRFGPQAPIFS